MRQTFLIALLATAIPTLSNAQVLTPASPERGSSRPDAPPGAGGGRTSAAARRRPQRSPRHRRPCPRTSWRRRTSSLRRPRSCGSGRYSSNFAQSTATSS